MGRWKRAVVALLAVPAAMWWPAPAGAATSLTVTPSPPVPYEPFTVTATGTGCPPGATITVALIRWNPSEGHGPPDVRASTDVVIAPDGSWGAVLAVPTGYPGWWEVRTRLASGVSGCDSTTRLPEIPTPSGFVMTATASPMPIQLDSVSVLSIAGDGCVAGADVAWHLMPLEWPYDSIASGSTFADATGHWEASPEVSASQPVFHEGEQVQLLAACQVAPGVYVEYQPVPLGALAAQAPSSAPSTGVEEASRSSTSAGVATAVTGAAPYAG